MQTSTTSLSEISYPVYRLVTKPNSHDGIIYYHHEKGLEDGGTETVLRILDDKNIEGGTLARRRLRMSCDPKVHLFKITNAIFFLGDLVKLASKKSWFIDSNGKLFNYEKKTRAKLKYYKITQVLPIGTGGAVIEVEGLTTRFKTLFNIEHPCTLR